VPTERPLVAVTAPVYVDTVSAQLSGLAEVRHLKGLPAAERAALISGAEVILAASWRREFGPGEARNSRAGLVQLLWAGADGMPFDQMPRDAVIASNVGAYAEPMAEHAVAMTLALMKRLPQNHLRLAAGIWDEGRTARVHGSVHLIVGFGGIGQAAGRILRALGARIYAINTSGRTTEAVDFAGTLDDLSDVLPEADAVLLSVPLTRRTRGLIGRHELALMKPGAVLVNVARGPVVDETALYEHLVAVPTFSAGIDTWWQEPRDPGGFAVGHPFFDLPNVLGSPHNSGMVPGTIRAAAHRAVDNIARFLRHEPVTGVVRTEDYGD
jgi:phosphoglycerate dehydrogenase-like enzyme